MIQPSLSLKYKPSSEQEQRAAVRDQGLQGVVVIEAGSYLRLIDSCITRLKAQEPSRTYSESKEEEEEEVHAEAAGCA